MADIVKPCSIVINDSNYRQFMTPPLGSCAGLIPRDFQTHPTGCYGRIAEPLNIQLIPESEWDDRISQQEKDQSSLQHIRDQGAFGGRIPSLDQNGQGFCWAYSTTMAVMLARAKENLPYKRLSGHMIGCEVKGFRDEGGWNGESLKFAVEKGIASVDTWVEKSMSRSNENAAMWEDAAKSRVTEWWDLSDNASTVKQQLATLLLLNQQTMIDLNWWGHSVCAVRLIKRSPFTIRILNSWTDSWGDAGMGDLAESKAIPNGAAAPRVTMAA